MYPAGTVVWALLGRYREGPAVLALGLLMALVSNTWIHLLAGVIIAVLLVRSSWQEARANRRTLGFVAIVRICPMTTVAVHTSKVLHPGCDRARTMSFVAWTAGRSLVALGLLVAGSG
ncbi:hypothetical protein [Herbidospora daliensis]|uniref:hypothetical protein n=1 Tax=Herbidospora daliensis TaxID=295585 RepID=UPI0007842BBB|nr:hypothetical protein [Herbidospora daliensis]